MGDAVAHLPAADHPDAGDQIDVNRIGSGVLRYLSQFSFGLCTLPGVGLTSTFIQERSSSAASSGSATNRSATRP